MSACTKGFHAALILFLLAGASLCIAFGILGALDDRFEPTLDYENGAGVHTLVYLLLVYGLLLAFITMIGAIGYFTRVKRFLRVAVPVALFITLLQILAFASVGSISDHLHLPVADVLYRGYDNSSVCWSGIERGNVSDASNCCQRDGHAYCVKCRALYVCNEATFANNNYWALFTILATSAVANFLFIQNMINRLCARDDVVSNPDTTDFSDHIHATPLNLYTDMPPAPPLAPPYEEKLL